MSKKFEYYEIRKLFKDYPDACYYMVYGERSNGKTYSSLDYAVERYVNTGEQFAYIRRWGEDVKKKNLSSLFSGHVENGEIAKLTKGKFSSVDYNSSKFYFTCVDEDGNKMVADEPFGYAFDLNSMEHFKSISFPKITTIIFDEFISRNGYLPNEWVLFTNCLSTIIRLRDNVKIIMLGNTVNRFCPYFKEMGLSHIKDQKEGTVDIYTYGQTGLQVACEYTPSSARKGGKPSDVYFAFDNPQLKMITGGAWEIAIYPHLEIKYRPKDVALNVFFKFDNTLLHGEIVCMDNAYFMFIHPKTTPIKDENKDIVYTDSPDQRFNYRMCLTKQSDKLSIAINKMFRENRVFYSDNETGETMRNYLIWSDSYSIKN